MNKKLDNFLKQTLDQVMSDRFGRYSKYIIQERALPDVRDGLKPVQRRIIFSMHELGLFSNRPFKKSARVVGDVIGKYHPHGDSSIYEALVRMSQTWKMNVPLIEMHGNNGSIDDDPAAAMRYTEVRLSNITNDLINNLKKNTVLFAPNFDDSEKEPIVLPALLPNLLVNGARGIAAGYATEMPPHNLGEVVDAIIAKIKSPNIRLETLLNYMQGPDFSTGGIVQGKAGIYEALATGRGKIVIRSKYEINVLKTKPSITITEIPYGVIKSKLVREIDEIRFESKIDGIKQVRDESDRNGLAIFIELMPGTNFKQVVNYLLAKTEMQVYYHYNNVAIKNKVPTQMNLITLIDAYLEHQREIQTKALEYELTKDQRRFEIITGLIKVSEMADNVIKTITNASGSKQGVINTLIAEYGFTQLQATAIAELQLYRLSKGDQSLYLEEKVVLSSRIEINEQILNSPEKFNKHLINLLKNFKQQHAVPRKTIIEDAVETIAINMDALIKHEPTWVGVSKQGYIKRFSNRKYEANNLSNYTLKASDSLQYLDYINTQDKLLVFTSFGNYFFISVHKIVENKFQEVGKHLNDFAPLSLNEHIISAIAVHDFETNAYVVLVSQQGKGKRVPIKDFIVSRSSKLYKAMKLNAGDQLISAKVSNGFQQIVIITTSGYAVKYLETQLPLQGLKSVGVKAINLKNNQVSVMAVVAQNEILGLVSHRGGMKRIKVTSILPTARTTQGTIIYKSLRANKHIILNATPVLPNTKVFFSNTNLITHLFKDVDITSRDVGLSLVTSQKPIGALINHFVYVDKNNDYFQSKTNIEAEDVFQQAEEVIDQVSQISLDDLLKDL